MKQNRYKNKSEHKISMGFISKPLIMIVILSLISIALIYTYDFIMQSTYFNIKKIGIIGNYRVKDRTIIDIAGIKPGRNILELNLSLVQKQILNNPWIQKVSVKRTFPSTLSITVLEETPFARVKIDDIADILINPSGTPFKEYEPELDKLDNLPIITGLDLVKYKDKFIFQGPLFDPALRVLNMERFGRIFHVNADKNMGIAIKTNYFGTPVLMHLGFYDFKSKAYKAERIARYFKKHLNNREILMFDLYDPENVLVKSKDKDALHNLIKGGA